MSGAHEKHSNNVLNLFPTVLATSIYNKCKKIEFKITKRQHQSIFSLHCFPNQIQVIHILFRQIKKVKIFKKKKKLYILMIYIYTHNKLLYTINVVRYSPGYIDR